MRIAYVLTSLGIGGAERQALALAERLRQRGHEAAFLVLRPPVAEEWPAPFRVVHLGMRRDLAGFVSGLFLARRFVGEFRPDLLHSHSYHANVFARLLRLLAPGVAVVSTIHNEREGGWGRVLTLRLTDGLSARTTAVSAAVARRAMRIGAVSRRKCVVVPNAIETGEFVPGAERRGTVRGSLRAGESFIWLAAGRIAPAKDLPTLLRAFARVTASRPDARLWIAGEPSRRFPQEPLRALAAALGVDAAVRWPGLRRDVPALLDAADGFVLSSAWEGMPLAVAEAMAMEKPVVATDVGGVRELVGGAGMVVPARSPEALAEAMVGVMELSSADRLALGRAARGRIEQCFCMETRAGEWEGLYRSLVTGKESIETKL